MHLPPRPPSPTPPRSRPTGTPQASANAQVTTSEGNFAAQADLGLQANQRAALGPFLGLKSDFQGDANGQAGVGVSQDPTSPLTVQGTAGTGASMAARVGAYLPGATTAPRGGGGTGSGGGGVGGGGSGESGVAVTTEDLRLFGVLP